MTELKELDRRATEAQEHLERVSVIYQGAVNVYRLAEARFDEALEAHDKALELLASEALKQHRTDTEEGKR